MIQPDLAQFPESRFVPSPERRLQYETDVVLGRSVMAGRRVVICGLARNIEQVLPRTIARTERIGSMFADYRVVLFENDSSDATPAMLAEWQRRNSRVTVLNDKLGHPVNRPVRCLERAERMAMYRNRYREHIAEHLADFDHTIVIDTDLEGGWSYDGLAHTFGQSEWDFVGSYGIIYKRIKSQPNVRLHYDAWAYREQGSYDELSTAYANLLTWQRGDPLVPVYSCFGGLGVYRTQALVQCEYRGTDVEHVPLHQQMREQGMGRQFLNPSQIVVYGRKWRTLDGLVLSWHDLLALFTQREASVWL